MALWGMLLQMPRMLNVGAPEPKRKKLHKVYNGRRNGRGCLKYGLSLGDDFLLGVDFEYVVLDPLGSVTRL